MSEPTGMDDPICEYCKSAMSDHDWEHLARHCYPVKLDKERADHEHVVEFEQAKLKGSEERIQVLYQHLREARQQLATAKAAVWNEAARRDHLKLQAQGHAQEAQAQRATVHEIYQILSDGKGEPGDWHGAEPARAFKQQLATAHQRINELEAREVDVALLQQQLAEAQAAVWEQVEARLIAHGLFDSDMCAAHHAIGEFKQWFKQAQQAREK